LWSPWIFKPNEDKDATLIYKFNLEGMQQILNRIFPVRRGIFEDKVATFWCVLHNFWKVNTIVPRETQVILTTGVTLVSCLPACFYLWMAPTKH